jgi:ferredoxin-thioredoxin reductase catalytic subunit
MKKFWRCHICNDIHFGASPPETCPTCSADKAYVEMSSKAAQTIISHESKEVDRPGFRSAIEKFAENKEFQVNPDEEKVNSLLDGIFNNETNHGLKYCPCRLIEKEFESDLKLICPCNFLVHNTYKEQEAGECWCGLFIKRRIS